MFIFTLLYNLLLLDRGLGEGPVGLIAGTATAGSVAGALPAALAARRFGLRATLMGCFCLVSALCALRAMVAGEATLVALAFVSGMALAAWAVALAPAIAQLTSEEQRPWGFSVFYSISVLTGVLGGVLAGAMPDWLGGKRAAILAGCGLTALALWPVSGLPLKRISSRPKNLWPRSRFLVRYLCAMAVWNLATGSFNPFFNTYFVRRFQMPAQTVGMLFSAAQLCQAGAMLLAPLLLRRLGLLAGIAALEAATALFLGGLAAGSSALAAGIAYACYTAFQFMSEPGLSTLLMGSVTPEERSGAAALGFLVAFGAQAVAAVGAGAGFKRFGYPPVLAVAAGLAALAALLFLTLRPPSPATSRAESAPA
jgi:MFS family permease